jgi:hypothetical protein
MSLCISHIPAAYAFLLSFIFPSSLMTEKEFHILLLLAASVSSPTAEPTERGPTLYSVPLFSVG